MLYRPDVCNCTMPYVRRTVPANAVRDPAYTAEVFALTLVQIDVSYLYSITVVYLSLSSTGKMAFRKSLKNDAGSAVENEKWSLFIIYENGFSQKQYETFATFMIIAIVFFLTHPFTKEIRSQILQL